MAEEIKTRIIQSGDLKEVYHYENTLLKGYDDKLDRQYRSRRTIPTKEKLQHRENKINQSKKQLRRLLHANYKDMDNFITLTFNKPICDIQEAKEYFVKFKDRVRKQMTDKFKYIAVFNYQECGRVHFHVLCNLSVYQYELDNLWKYGYTLIEDRRDYKSIEDLVRYMCKHIDNRLITPDMINKQYYLNSHGLSKPKEIINPNDIDYIVDKDDLIFKTEFQNDYIGRIQYQKYLQTQ